MAYDDLNATIDPIRRAITLFLGIPGLVGTIGNSKGWRAWRWQTNSPGVWTFHWCPLLWNRLLLISHITSRITLGLQMMVTTGRTDQMPPYQLLIKRLTLSRGQAIKQSHILSTSRPSLRIQLGTMANHEGDFERYVL